jgi:hypothetical protein
MACSRCEQKRIEMHKKLLEAYLKGEGIDNVEDISPKQLHIFKRKLRIQERNKRIELRNLRNKNKEGK